MPEIGKGRITPGTGSVEYSKKSNTVAAANTVTAGQGSHAEALDINELRARLISAEDKLTTLIFDLANFSKILTAFEALMTAENEESLSVQQLVAAFPQLTSSVQGIEEEVVALRSRVSVLEEVPEDAPVDAEALLNAISALTDRTEALEETTNNAVAQLGIIAGDLADAVQDMSGKASQAGLDAVAASVVTKANKLTKINTGGLLTGGGDLSQDRSLLVQKATAAEVEAGVIDHKAVTPASLIGVLNSIRNILEPIGIGTTNLINTRCWIPGLQGDQGKFKELKTANTAQNYVTMLAGPKGSAEPIWSGKSLSGASAATQDINGGFEYQIDKCDDDYNPKHTYRFSIWLKQDDTDGAMQFGCSTGITYLNNGTVSDPYFLKDFNVPEKNKWYLLVGMIYGHTYTGSAEQFSGLYDPASGRKVLDGMDYKAKSSSACQKLRIFRKDASYNNSFRYFARPRIDIITGEEPSIPMLFGIASDLNAASSKRKITTDGLAQGGGDLTQDRVISVPKASADEVAAGEIDDKAVTPKSLKGAVIKKASPKDVEEGKRDDVSVTPFSLQAVKKATRADIEQGDNDYLFVTPASLKGVSFGGTGTGSVFDKATEEDVAAGTSDTKAVTPKSLKGLRKASTSDVAAKMSDEVLVTPLSLRGLTVAKASKLQVNARISNDVFVTPASLSDFVSYGESSTRDGTAIAAPVIANDGTAVDHTLNRDGSADISFEWDWSGMDNSIDGWEVHVRTSTSSSPYVVGAEPDSESIILLPAQHRAAFLYGIAADRYYTFGVRAYRMVDQDIDPTGFIKSSTVQPTLAGENPFQPTANIAFNGDITGTINGMSVQTVQTGITNFNNRNDRNDDPIPAPVIKADGSAIDHTLNTDGSANISFEWQWQSHADEPSIDGFIVSMHVSDSSAFYNFTGDEADFNIPVSANKRAFIQPGVAADKYYSFAVQAYRIVDNDVAPEGFIYSDQVQSSVPAERPYRPQNEVAFLGNILGTIDGVSASDVKDAVDNFNYRNDRNADPIIDPTVLTNGTAVDHVENTDGSVDISFEWNWSGAQDDIDGFEVYVLSRDNSTVYLFNDGQAAVYDVPAYKRAFILNGVAADKYYSFAVRAYRFVDQDIAENGFIHSALVRNTAENPYQPMAEVAFKGSIAGTLTNLLASDIADSVVNFKSRNDRLATPIILPSIDPNGGAIDHTVNTDGSVNLSFEWSWFGDERDIDGFYVYQAVSDIYSTHTFGGAANEFSIVLEANKRSLIIPGVAADKYYSFGVRAYRVVDPDIDPSGVIKTDIVHPTLAEENPYRPMENISFGGDISGTINNVSAADITSAYDNFNARNDRKSDPVLAPVVAGDETAIDHVLNNDSSCDISFEWKWTGDEADIDGFYVIYHTDPASGITPAAYQFDNPSSEVVIPVPADRRAIFLNGVAADKFYSFAVLAYRIVDPDVAEGGVIKSLLVKTSHPNETPYRPTENLAFVGELTGTIDGESQAYVADAARNFNLRNDRNASPVIAPAIPSDGTAIDHTLNNDGSANISFEWTYSGSEDDIDGFIVYRNVSTTNNEYVFTQGAASDLATYVPADKRSFLSLSVSADKYYSFGVRSYRRVDSDVAPEGFIQSPVITPTATGEHPYRPVANIAFAGNITGTIGNTAVSTITQSVVNFNNRNDRLATPVLAPSIPTNGDAVDHTLNDNGSADISFEWTWAGDEATIDGFIVYTYIGTTAAVYNIGATPSNEFAQFVPASKRAIIMQGATANRYYSFGIRAYRIVDTDVNSSGYIQSALVQPSRSDEHPYQPSANVAFAGNITGTINGTAVATVSTAVANFNKRNDRLSTAIPLPVVATNGEAVDHVVNTDGSADLSFEWTWTGTEADIDGFYVYYRGSTSSGAYTFGTGEEGVITLPANKRAAILSGVPINKYYSFGVRAYRIVDGDIAPSGVIQTVIVKPSRSDENPYLPSANVAFGGDITGTIGGVEVATVKNAVQNFNTRNDRNKSAIAAPTIKTDGSSIEHVRNSDGSVSINFGWDWTGVEDDIDGFMVYNHVDISNLTYSFTNAASEGVIYVPADRRRAFFYGVPATKFYSFAVRAYRYVDPDINNTGVIYSSLAKPTRGDENPYQPSSVVTIGEDGSTITLPDLITTLGLASSAYADTSSLSGKLAEYGDDSFITPLERLLIRREIAEATVERSTLRDSGSYFLIGDEMVAEASAWTNLLDFLNGMIPSYLSDSSNSTPINRTLYNNIIKAWKQASQELSNAIAVRASKAAEWGSITGDGKPEDNATANPQTKQEFFPTGFMKVGGTEGDWDSSVRSLTGYAGDFTLRFKVDRDPGHNREMVIGINADPTTTASYTGMDFGFSFYQEDRVRPASWTGNTPTWHAAEANFSYDSVFEINRAGSVIRFSIDGGLVATVGGAGSTTYYVDSSMRASGRLVYFMTVFGPEIKSQPKYAAINADLDVAVEGQSNFDGLSTWTLINGQWVQTATTNQLVNGPYFPGYFRKLGTDTDWSGSAYSVDDNGAVRLFPVGSRLYFRVPDSSGVKGVQWGECMIGLNRDPMSSESFSDIDAAVHFSAPNTIIPYLNGQKQSQTATVFNNEWLYFENGPVDVLLKRALNDSIIFGYSFVGGAPLAVDSTFRDHNSYVDGVTVVRPNGEATPVRYKIKEAAGEGGMVIYSNGYGQGTVWTYQGQTRTLLGGLWTITASSNTAVLHNAPPGDNDVGEVSGDVWYYSDTTTGSFRQYVWNADSKTWIESGEAHKTYTQNSDPALTGTIVDGDSWVNPDNSSVYLRKSGAWILIATVGAPEGSKIAGVNAEVVRDNAANGLKLASDIVADSILSPDEKRALVIEWDRIKSEYQGLYQQATDLNISSHRDALKTAYDALDYYLNTTLHQTGAEWNNVAVNTPVDPTVYKTKFVNYYTAVDVLISDITAAAAAQAVWSNVSGYGRPANFATRNEFKGTWAGGRPYIVGDLVAYNGAAYTCTIDHTSSAGSPPPNANFTLLVEGGADSITGLLTNESHNVPADSDGVVASYIGSGGRFQLFQGAQEITSGIAYSVSNSSNVTASISSSGVYTITALSADSGTVTFRASFDFGQGSQYVDKVYSITKARAGRSSKSLVLNSDRQAIVYGADGTIASGQATNFTAVLQLVSSNVDVLWSATTLDGSPISANDLLVITGTQKINAVMSPTNFDAFRGGTKGVIVTATITDGAATLTDSQSIIMLQDGRAGAAGSTSRLVSLTGTGQIFAFENNTSFAANAVNEILLTASLQNAGSAVNWSAKDAGGDVSITDFSRTDTTLTISRANFGTTRPWLRIRATSQTDATAYDEFTIYKTVNGLNALQGVLTNEAHAVPTDYQGNYGDYSGAQGIFRVFYGGTEVTNSCLFTAGTATNVSAQLNASANSSFSGVKGAYRVTAMNADTGSFVMTATYTVGGLDLKTTSTFTLAKSKSGRDGTDGVDGTPGAAGISPSLVSLSATGQIFSFDTDTAFSASTPASIFLSAALANAGSSVVWTASDASGAVSTSGWTSTAQTLTVSQSNFGTTRGYLKIRATAVANSSVYDELTIYKVVNGLSALQGVLSNESHTVPTTSDGSSGNYSGAGGLFTVYYGSTDVTANAVFTAGTASGCTAQINTSQNQYFTGSKGAYQVSAMTADTASFTMTATYTTGGKTLTSTKVFTLSKSKAGVAGSNGTSAKLVQVTATNQIYSFSTPTTFSTGAPSSIILSASLQNAGAGVVWAATDSTGTVDISGWSSSTTTLTVSQTNFGTSRTWLRVRATSSSDASVYDDYTIYKTIDGQSVLQTILTNEAVSVPTASDGTSGDFSQATGLIKVFYGSQDVTATSTLTAGTASNCVADLNATTNSAFSGAKGAYRVTSMSADQASFVMSASYVVGSSTVVSSSTFTLAKARAGVQGTRGQDGTNGTNGTSAKLVFLTATNQVFAFDTSTTFSASAPSTIILSATLQNTGAAVNWSAVDASGTVSLSGWSASPTTLTVSQSNFGTARDWIRIKASSVSDPSIVDEFTIYKTVNGLNSLSGFLTNEAHSISVAADNTGGDFSLANGLFKVYYGAQDVTANCTFAAGTPTGCSGQINTTANSPIGGQPKGYYAVSALTADTATYPITATYTIGSQTLTTSATFTLARVRRGQDGTNGINGTNGADARSINLSGTNQVFIFKDNTTFHPSSSSSIIITALLQNTGSSVSWSAVDDNGSVSVSAWSQSATTLTISQANFGTSRAWLRVRATSVLNTGIYDEFTVFKSVYGLAALQGVLTNESQGVPTDPDGNNPGLALATGEFKVYFGGVDVTSSSTFTAGTATGCSAQINTSVDQYFTGAKGAYRVTAITADTASFPMTATYSAGGTTLTTSGIFTLAKIRAGTAGKDGYEGKDGQPGKDGATAKVLTLSSTGQVFTFSSPTSFDPSTPASLTITAALQNAGTGVNWSAVDSLGPVSLSGFGQTATTLTVSQANFTTSRNYLQITATAISDATIQDVFTIGKVVNGSNTLTSYLTNEAHVIPTDYTGANGDYSGANGLLKVFYGSQDVTDACTLIAGDKTGCSADLNRTTNQVFTGPKGAYRVTAMTAETASFEIIAQYVVGSDTLSATSYFTLAKTRAGAPGSDGQAGQAGNDARAIDVSATDQIFLFENSSTFASSAPASIDLAASMQNAGSSVVWTATDASGAVSTTSWPTTATTIKITQANFGTTRKWLRVRATSATYSAVYDDFTIYKTVSGLNALSVIASNETHGVPVDTSGNASYANAFGNLKVYYGGTDVTASSTITAGTATNCTAQVNTATNTPVSAQPKGYYRVTAMSADQASFVMNVSYSVGDQILSGTTTFTLARVKSGADGLSAAVVRVQSTGQVFPFNSDAATFYSTAPASIDLVASLQNTGSSVNWSAVDDSGTVNVASFATAPTATTLKVSQADFGSTRKFLRITATSVANSAIADVFTISKIVAGADGVTGVLSNESHTVPTASDGTSGDFSLANGTFRVYYGAVEVTNSCTFSVSSQTGCTGTITTSSPKGQYSVSAMSANTASLVLNAAFTYGGKSFSIDRTFTLSKSKTGAKGDQGDQGAPSRTVDISATGQVFAFDTKDSFSSSAVSAIVLTANLQQAGSAVTWTAADASGTVSVSGWTSTGTTLTVSQANFGTTRDYLTVTATSTTYGTAIDKFTIYKTVNGLNAVRVVLTNEAVAVPTDYYGANPDFSQAFGLCKVYYGATDVTSAASFTGTATNCTASVNTATDTPVSGQPRGYYRATAMSADTASFVITANYTIAGQTFTSASTFSLSKAKAGLAGTSAQTVSIQATNQSFLFDTPTAFASSAVSAIDLVASLQNTGSSVTWTATDASGTVSLSGFTSTTTTLRITQANFGTSRAWLRIRATSATNSAVYDDFTIYKVINGLSALDAFLTNETHAIPFDSTGSTGIYTNAVGEFKVYYSGSEVTSAATFALGTASNVTAQINTTANQYFTGSKGAYQVTALNADVGSVALVASYVVGGQTLTQTKVFSVSKARAGAAGAAGVNAFNIVMTNEAHTVATDASGNNGNFSTANGLLKVYSGITEVTSSATFGSPTASGCTGTVNTADNTPTNGQPKGYYAVSALSADQATLAIPVSYGGSTITKLFTLTRSKTGSQGASAVIIDISATSQFFAYDNAGVIKPNQSITFKATRQNTSVATSWLWRDKAGGGLRSGSAATVAGGDYFTSPDNDTLVMTGAQFQSFASSAANRDAFSLEVSVTDGSTTVKDIITVTKLSDGLKGNTGDNGRDGATTYTYVAYADDINGSSNFTTGAPGTRAFIGIANNRTETTAPTSASVYVWSRLTGTQGVAGTSGYTWFAYASSADGSVNFDNGDSKSYHTYIGIAANKTTPVESTNYVDYTWTKIKGETGSPGSAGKDGTTTYTYVAYADDINGSSNFTTGSPGTRAFIGIANNRTESSAPTNPAIYVWSRLTGTQGVAGTSGYTWFAYASSADGSVNFDNGVAQSYHTYIGIAANKTTPVESTNYVDYTWSKIKGEDGGGSFTLVADTANTKVTPNTVYSPSSGGWGLAHAHSIESFSGGAVATWTVGPDSGLDLSAMAGLGQAQNSSNSYDSITFAIFRETDGTTAAYINGGKQASGPTVSRTSPARFKVHYDGLKVRYYVNDSLFYTFNWGRISDALYFVTALASTRPHIENITFAAAGAVADNNVVAYLTNESHNVPCDSAGNPTSYSGASGQMRVFFGLTEVTGSCSFSVPTASNLNIGLDGAGNYSVNSLTADIGTATIRATYNGNVIDKVFSVSKTKTGVQGSPGGTGAAAINITISSSEQAVKYDTNNIITTGDITITTIRQNTGATPVFTLQSFDGTIHGQANFTAAQLRDTYGTGTFNSNGVDNLVLKQGWLNAVLVNGTYGGGIRVSTTVSGVSDVVSLVKVKDGNRGSDGSPGGKGDTGLKGDTGSTGPQGRSAVVFQQDSQPTSGYITGDTWYKPSTKQFYTFNGSSWVQITGKVGSYDVIDAAAIAAGAIQVNSLSAISATLGTFRSANTGQRTEISGSVIQVFDSNNALRVRLGIF